MVRSLVWPMFTIIIGSMLVLRMFGPNWEGLLSENVRDGAPVSPDQAALSKLENDWLQEHPNLRISLQDSFSNLRIEQKELHFEMSEVLTENDVRQILQFSKLNTIAIRGVAFSPEGAALIRRDRRVESLTIIQPEMLMHVEVLVPDATNPYTLVVVVPESSVDTLYQHVYDQSVANGLRDMFELLAEQKNMNPTEVSWSAEENPVAVRYVPQPKVKTAK